MSIRQKLELELQPRRASESGALFSYRLKFGSPACIREGSLDPIARDRNRCLRGYFRFESRERERKIPEINFSNWGSLKSELESRIIIIIILAGESTALSDIKLWWNFMENRFAKWIFLLIFHSDQLVFLTAAVRKLVQHPLREHVEKTKSRGFTNTSLVNLFFEVWKIKGIYQYVIEFLHEDI